MINIKLIRLIVILLVFLLISGCSLTDTKKIKLTYESIDLDEFSYVDKQKNGVELLYSPNKQRVIYADRVKDFNYLYVVEDESHTKIFDFKEVFGEYEVRDMVPLSYFWKDDKSIYVTLTYTYSGTRVYEINMSNKKTSIIDVPVNGYIVGYSSQSNSFLMQTTESEMSTSYILYDQLNGEKTGLPRLDNLRVKHFNDGKYILSDNMDMLESQILLYDSNINNYYNIELNSNDLSNLVIIPNQDKISVFDNNDLVIYDYKKNKVLSRFSLSDQDIDVDISYMLNWNIEGSCYYSNTYLVCKK